MREKNVLKFYGSHLCKDCVNLKANCEKYGIAYEYSDISNDLAALKEFLKLRDENPVFAEAKQAGGIGIPAIVNADGTVTLDWMKVIVETGNEPFEEMKSSCCLADRSGC